MRQSKWSRRTDCPARLSELVFTKRSIWYGILSKPNYTEKAPRITGENGRKSPVKTGLKVTGQGAVRMMLRQARNSFHICSTLPGSAASLCSRSRHGFRFRMCVSCPVSSVPIRSMNGGRRNGNDRRTAAGTALVVFGTEYVPQYLSGAIHVPLRGSGRG